MRVYSVTMDAVSVSSGITLLQIKAGAAAGVLILRASCSQSNQTSSAMQRIQILRKTAAATVTSYTPLIYDKGDSAANAAGGTSATGTNASAEGTDGDILVDSAFNVLNGYLWIPTPEERIVVAVGEILAMKLPAAPASAMTTTAQFIFGEIGG